VIQLSDLTKTFGDRTLFDHVTWQIGDGERVGLCGPNGAGKTTLLKILGGIEESDSGAVVKPVGLSIGYLPQDGLTHSGRTVFEEASSAFQPLLDIKAEMHDIEHKLGDAAVPHDEHDAMLSRYSELQDRFRLDEGYSMDLRIATVLRGLGFSSEDADRPCETFSGGWQMRIALAKLLLARPNLLLMDEPTNHLDLPARNWLEEYLADYPGSVVLVSHDRYFLDATVKRITEVGLKTLTDYHGNYSHYVVEHTARMERLREAHRRQSEEIEKAEVFINRFRYQATKAKQVQSRIKQLDKVERIEIPPARKKIRFTFPEAPRPGRVVLETKGLRKAYGDNVVLQKLDLMVERGDRIALVGPNGAGKSTLMRLLAGIDRPDEGVRLEGHKVVLDYFAQDQAAVLNPARTVVEEMSAASSLTMAPMIRTILGGFLFEGDDVYKKVAVLSGGERNRLALAKMLLTSSNVLLLDEPTNHLDLDSKEVLLDALADYGGTLVFVSHDRYFVDKLATKVIEVGGGEALVYPGGYEDFLYWKKSLVSPLAMPLALPPAQARKREDLDDGAASVATSAPSSSPVQSSSGRPVPSKTSPQSSKPNPGRSPATAAAPAPKNPLGASASAPRLRQSGTTPERQVLEREVKRIKTRLSELETRVAEAEQAVKTLEAQMAEPGFYDDRARAAQAAEEHQKRMWQAGELMAQWEALQAEYDEKSQQLAAVTPTARR
jgi:ATP-binding cassette, subfamily F, member 3